MENWPKNMHTATYFGQTAKSTETKLQGKQTEIEPAKCQRTSQTHEMKRHCCCTNKICHQCNDATFHYLTSYHSQS